RCCWRGWPARASTTGSATGSGGSRTSAAQRRERGPSARALGATGAERRSPTSSGGGSPFALLRRHALVDLLVMLLELRVENLLLIERAELQVGPGLTAITGETGAGKTILAHALDLLLGGRPRSGIVRPGAREAYVEGVFACPPGGLVGDELAELHERLPEGEDELVLGRRVGAEGRTRAFVQGRSASASD